MTIDERLITELVEGQDPLDAIWRRMERICALDEFPQDLRALMSERESALNVLERGVYHGFYEVYDLLLERTQQQGAERVLTLLDECPFVIIADSLSVREAVLLETLWDEGKATGDVATTGVGWSVQREGFAEAPFPPMTESLSRPLLGVPSPAGGRDKPQFSYRYVAGPEHIPAMPAEGPLLVWMRLPDTALEKVTMAQAQTMADAFDSLVETLLNVLQASGRDEGIITSDHGYIYARSPTHYWGMPGGVEDKARSTFLRYSRARPLDDKRVLGLREHESPAVERRFFAFGRTHATVRGRYWWGSASPNDRCTSHGGLSFIECLVPILRVLRR